jgi:hypothetical protein
MQTIVVTGLNDNLYTHSMTRKYNITINHIVF